MDEVTKAINDFSALMEQQNSKLDAVLEGINSLPTRADFHRLEEKVDKLSDDMATVKAVVTATNRDLAEHKRLSADEAHGSGHVSQPDWAAA